MDVNHLIAQIAKPQQISNGVVGYFIPHRIYKQNISYDALVTHRGNDALSNIDAILLALDAQTQRIEIDDDASDVWHALAVYLDKAPVGIVERMNFYAYLSTDMIFAWWDAYHAVMDKDESIIEDMPTDPNLRAAGGETQSES